MAERPEVIDQQQKLIDDNLAIRKMLADELRAGRCNGLAAKVERGVDLNVRTLATINLVRRLTGLPRIDWQGR